MSVTSRLLQDPAEEETARGQKFFNNAILILLVLSIVPGVMTDGISVPVFLFTTAGFTVAGLITGEGVAFGFGYFSPLARGIFTVSFLAGIGLLVVSGVELDIPPAFLFSFLLGMTLGTLIVEILWMLDA